MTEDQLQKLIEANIPEEWMENCFITEDDMIFTPRFDEQGIMISNGEQVYNKWLEGKDNKIDICPTKTVEERLEETEQRLAESEEEKKLLKAQVEALNATTDFHEELMAEMAMILYA